ncbi:MAG: hypothetical protein JW789_02910 [Candidatus Aenigmarchaeota archaeon]|nr:hypothetical protein [Candidatus Aenigmarchaeota archaeon]
MTAKEDLKQIRISVALHVAVAFAIGLIAPFIGSGYYVLVASMAIAVVVGHVTQMIVGKKAFSWWFGNGLFIYFFVIADVWIFISNYF